MFDPDLADFRMSMRLTRRELESILEMEIRGAGGSAQVAKSLATATVAAEADGQQAVGIAHLFDYLDAMRMGRIDPQAQPLISRPLPAVHHSDAGGGIAQLGFDMAFDALIESAGKLGVSVFSQCNAYLCGSLGYYAGRIADAGMIAFAATNGSPLLAGSGSRTPVFCTNPMAFAAPQSDGPALLIDQSSSATAFLNIREAAEKDEEIPLGWALDREGNATTDAKAAMEGTLLAFGGARGANIALMVEILAAGVSGANWSLDAPPFDSGSSCPRTGLFVLSLNPETIAADFEERLSAHLGRLAAEHGVHLPGMRKAAARLSAHRNGFKIDDHLLARFRTITNRSGN